MVQNDLGNFSAYTISLADKNSLPRKQAEKAGLFLVMLVLTDSLSGVRYNSQKDKNEDTQSHEDREVC